MAVVSMMRTTEYLTWTTKLTTSLDPFDDALDDLRISGTVLLHETYAAPWSIAVPQEQRLREVLGAGADVRVLPFHLVRRNSFELHMEGRAPVTVSEPEVLICPSGAPHRMSSGHGGGTIALDDILRGNGPALASAEDETATELVCGVFMARAAPLNPMLGALPPVLKVSTGDTRTGPMLSGAAEMLAAELARGSRGGFTASRLLEVICAEAFRAYQRAEGAENAGWFRGLADPKISEAIRQVHADPAHEWTVEKLADTVALSPSRFAARFRDTTGQSVIAYVGRWRANVACRLLRDTDLPLTEIGHRVGYDSLPAFSRAFKAQLGMPPATWRSMSS